MSKRDEMAEKYATMECLASDHKEVDGIGYACFQAGWDAALANAPEVLALYELLKAVSNEPDNYIKHHEQASIWLAKVREALTQYKESIK